MRDYVSLLLIGPPSTTEAAMSFIRSQLRAPVAYVTLDHEDGNRINFEMRVELRSQLQE